MSFIYRSVMLVIVLFIFIANVTAEELKVVRLNGGNPIITSQMFEKAGAPDFDGKNINGPSLIKVPEWLKASGKVIHKDANYYLYFAHHKGKYIRLAWASRLEGPWHLHGTNKPYGSRGVLDMGEKARIDLGYGLTIHKHIASPDVFVDDKQRKILMYFHSPVLINGKPAKEQKSFVAISPDGLDFNSKISSDKQGIIPFVLGKSYFRVFEWRDSRYALSKEGFLYKDKTNFSAQNLASNFQLHKDRDTWQRRKEPLLRTIRVGHLNIEPRHSTVKIIKNHLWVFYTRVGDAPERILLSRINITKDWLDWREMSQPIEVLKPELSWEGAAHPLSASKKGHGIHQRALRDPYIYEEAGKYYLLYTGAGEEAIGLARLDITNN